MWSCKPCISFISVRELPRLSCTLFCSSSRDLTQLLKVSNSSVNFKSLSSFSSISARRAFVDLHFGQPWLSSSKTSSSVCELPSRVRFIFLSLRASQDIFGLFLGITELLFCEKWSYSGPRRGNFNRAIETRPSWWSSTPVSAATLLNFHVWPFWNAVENDFEFVASYSELNDGTRRGVVVQGH